MSLVAVRDELAKRLATLDGLRVYPVPPDTVSELPAAVIQPGQPLAEYGRTLSGGDVTYTFAVLLLTQSGDDEQAWQDLAAYLSPSGSSSVKAAVETSTGPNPGPADWLRVQRATEGGHVTYRKNAYWGATFHVRAYVGG
ncbi:MAG: hypothetical protein OXR67_14860 [Chloroflexota bacterium]|nr:hypothetical protein [Chloroflexota bacterium]